MTSLSKTQTQHATGVVLNHADSKYTGCFSESYDTLKFKLHSDHCKTQAGKRARKQEGLMGKRGRFTRDSL